MTSGFVYRSRAWAASGLRPILIVAAIAFASTAEASVGCIDLFDQGPHKLEDLTKARDELVGREITGAHWLSRVAVVVTQGAGPGCAVTSMCDIVVLTRDDGGYRERFRFRGSGAGRIYGFSNHPDRGYASFDARGQVLGVEYSHRNDFIRVSPGPPPRSACSYPLVGPRDIARIVERSRKARPFVGVAAPRRDR